MRFYVDTTRADHFHSVVRPYFLRGEMQTSRLYVRALFFPVHSRRRTRFKRTRMDRENFLSTRNVASVRQEEEIGSAHRSLRGNGAKEIGEIGIERGNK